MGLLFNVGVVVFAAHAVTSQVNDGIEGPVIQLVQPSEEVTHLLNSETHSNGNEVPQQGLPGLARRKRCSQYGCNRGSYYPVYPAPVIQPDYPVNPNGGCVGYGCNVGTYPVGNGFTFGTGSARNRGR